MSGLAAVLAGRRTPGLAVWEEAAEPADVRHTVEQSGWAFAHVDGWGHRSRADLLAALATALALPDWFGHNLDALDEALGDLSGPTVLLWDGWGPLARADGATFAVVLEVLGERAGHGGPPFAALLRGEGPPLPGVPRLE